MNRKLAIFWSVSQILIGCALLLGTILFSQSVLPAVQAEAARVADNSRVSADALLSAADAYGTSAEGLFALTNTLADIGGTLTRVSERVNNVGNFFESQGQKLSDFAKECEKVKINVPFTDKDPSFGWFGTPFRGMGEWCLKSGTNLSQVGADVGAVATAVSSQGDALSAYGNEGHEKTLLAMRTTADTLSHTSELLEEGKALSACGSFLVALGVCVALLFLMNGIIVLFASRNAKQA